MRSSIACSRCRRSKTKCDNNGIRDTDGNLAACKSCAAGNRKCEYPAPTPTTNNHSQRRESTATTFGEEVPAKKRKRPVAPTAPGTPFRSRGKPGIFEDTLDSPLLTPKVWDELWAIYEKHFSVDFPFLHKRTFLGPLQKLPPVSSSETGRSPQDRRMQDPALVLAFLTLTSPFHAELVAQTNNPYRTAEDYAEACKKCLTCDWNKTGDAAMQLVQALLMLGYHEWTACHSRNGYMRIHEAVGFARMNGYHNPETTNRQSAGDDAATRRDRFIQEESRRRTFWSCFIMDRYLSHGKNRPKIIQLEDFAGRKQTSRSDKNFITGSIQIPCSDKNFIAGRAVKTRFFGETDIQYADRRKETDDKAMLRNGGHSTERIEWEDREEDGILGRYIYALDHLSAVNKWANDGGRRSEPENIGPWNPKTRYYDLNKRLQEIKRALPDELQLSPFNTENHVYAPPSATSRIYFMLHAVLMLTTSYLAPEYLPTFGFKQTGPTGPLDDPKVTENVPDDQPDYWVAKAAECFEYVRDFVGILRSFKERDLVVESPFMGHAFWRAAWAAMYCHYVPKMDPSKALNSKLEPNAWDITNQVLHSMQKKFRIPRMYSADLATVANTYAQKRRDYVACGGSPQSTASDSDGGLQEYSAKMEVAHKQFGSLEIDGRVFTLPPDALYVKLESLDLEDDSENPATPHSPVIKFKTEEEKPRRSTSTAASVNSAFTPVNQNNFSMSAPREAVSANIEASNGTISSHGLPAHQPPQPQHQHQHQQVYHNQALPPYGTAAYDYPGNTPVYTPSTPQFSFPPYRQNSGSVQGPVNSSYNHEAMLELEFESNRSLVNRGGGFFEANESYSSYQGHSDIFEMNYPVDLSQSQTQYNPQNSQDPYGWQGHGSGYM